MRHSTADALLALVAFIAGFILAMAVMTTAGASPSPSPNVCPEEGKVESVVDGDIDGIVLDAGTLVCIKGGQTLVTVTADGTSTLAELLGTGQNVSHYTVLEEPSVTTTTAPTTTTTSTPTTTTTIVETTTTTGPAVSTTVPESESTTTSVTSTTSTSTPSTPGSVSELPYTGPAGLVSLMLLGATLIGLGLAVLKGDRL